MESRLAKMLHLKYAPVGISFRDKKPQGAFEFDRNKRNCVVSMLLMAAKGKTVAVDDAGCTCPGGAVGLCFGNAFERRRHPTRYLLSTGSADVPEGETVVLPPHMCEGERFFRSPEAVDRWKASLPFGGELGRFVVFEPLADWDASCPPELVFMLVDPDQLSALVCMAGFRSGAPCDTIAPFGAACQSILFAEEQRSSKNPKMVLGLFDISQRGRVERNLLSVTIPYEKFLEFEEDSESAVLSSHSWKELERQRYPEE